ncbi:Iron-regulated ABC transporter permease protein SufD [Micromonospora echinaurantiaca]|uniref:Iron-regulated ABC transporter permease protein SufD n=1 Tax=Micromonospora echinaurantiaca TaxID=47857 RepID=A0A1C5HAA7_9ACTN|nr:Fe-S cluster assembly protein SufD [Micromonospora echinaurantiaca]SCG42959.1 Iron-regulated ABC transporter permease protein SufD [Micromonospora echinaurantiaca]
MTTQASAPPSTKSQALRSYDVADFPALTGLEEEWRFTPLKRLRGLLDGAGASAGQVVTQVWSPDGVTAEWVERDDARLGRVLVPFDRLSAQAWSGFDKALVVTVAREAVLADMVSIEARGQGDALAYQHILLDVQPLAEATVVLDQQGSATLADNVEVAVGDGAKLTLVTIADWADDAVQAQHLKVKLGRDARVIHVQVSLGGDLVRQYTSVEYTDRGGEAELYGLYFADSGQHLEHRQLVDHAVPDCRSYVGYRGALQGESARTVWVGDVLIRAEATGTDTYEINRNLLLTDGARADSVPNLEIETGEIAGAGHASATGRFDDEQLFYLMARGIPEAEARRLVVRGFFAELINKIPVEELRERLGDAIEDRLAKAGA